MVFDERDLNTNYEVLRQQVEFTPDIVSVKGPLDAKPTLGSNELPFLLEEIVLGADVRAARDYRLRLHPNSEKSGLRHRG